MLVLHVSGILEFTNVVHAGGKVHSPVGFFSRSYRKSMKRFYEFFVAKLRFSMTLFLFTVCNVMQFSSPTFLCSLIREIVFYKATGCRSVRSAWGQRGMSSITIGVLLVSNTILWKC